ncbi:MAG: hypothetical protein ABSH41_27745, partial [Syntrophobacteraceae bacterium]
QTYRNRGLKLNKETVPTLRISSRNGTIESPQLYFELLHVSWLLSHSICVTGPIYMLVEELVGY